MFYGLRSIIKVEHLSSDHSNILNLLRAMFLPTAFVDSNSVTPFFLFNFHCFACLIKVILFLNKVYPLLSILIIISSLKSQVRLCCFQCFISHIQTFLLYCFFITAILIIKFRIISPSEVFSICYIQIILTKSIIMLHSVSSSIALCSISLLLIVSKSLQA